jgi:hypothetical protein
MELNLDQEVLLEGVDMLWLSGGVSEGCCGMSRPVAGQLMVVKRLTAARSRSRGWKGGSSMPVGQCDFKPVDVGNNVVDPADSDTVQPVDAFLAEDDWSVLYEAGRA